jgi:hypothetical protein
MNEEAARNFCTRVARAELLVRVDDDVCVEPGAILRLLEKYQQRQGWHMVGGDVAPVVEGSAASAAGAAASQRSCSAGVSRWLCGLPAMAAIYVHKSFPAS